MLSGPQRLARSRSGLPQPAGTPRVWWRRLLRSPYLWGSVVLTLVYAACLYGQYLLLSPDQELPDGTVALGINDQAIGKAAFWAMWTLLVWAGLFVWLDRWRAQNPVIWLWAIGWGAAVSTWLSLHVNTWAAEMMSVEGSAADTGARPAIFIAPFVEEATKASVLFLFAILMRYRLVNRLNVIALAGFSAIGFAFCENIIYYGRAVVYGTTTIEVGDPDAALYQLVLLRGVFTSFGHPLFTAMTGFGLAVGLRSRSKIVRVMAPLTGFLAASFGHMLFNGLASIGIGDFLMTPFPLLAVFFTYVMFLTTGIMKEGRFISARLTDFVLMGWLPPRDPEVFSRHFSRVKLLLASVFRGPRCVLATVRFMRGITELAYLRDARARGIVAAAGIDREKELLETLHQLRGGKALTEPQGLKIFVWPFKRRRAPVAPPPPVYPGPAGIAGQWPAPR